MRIIFFGTSSFAADILKYLCDEGHDVVAVVTQPDRPKGRKLHLAPPPVKEIIVHRTPHLPVYQPEKASTDAFASLLKKYDPELFIVVAYGEIIKSNLLDLPKLGAINIHTSLLPKYRGAAPIQRAMMGGETETGVTIIRMVLEMDAGDIVGQSSFPLSEEMLFPEVEKKLQETSCSLLEQVLSDYQAGSLTATPQDHTQATFAPKITKKDCKIDWKNPAYVIHNQVRALSPKPGAWTHFQLKDRPVRLKILQTRVVEQSDERPGVLVPLEKNRIAVATSQNALELLTVQPEGKRAMLGQEFFIGHKNSISNFQ